nr:uncharacterized protein K02A2.6-like [Aedes albopictus]
MNNDIEKLIRSCLDCQTVGQPGPQEPMQIRDLPQAPWSHLSMDILGPLPSGESLLVLIDLYSRFRVIEILRQTTTASILSKIRPVFMRLGIPQTLTTDNASNFSSREMVDFCKRYDIQLKHTTPYWPQANGNVERQNRSIMKILRISALNGSDWKADLEEHNYVYSVTPHPATGRSPAEVAFGRPFKDWIPQFFRIDFDDDEDIRVKDRAYKTASKTYHDRVKQVRESTINEGDRVLMKNHTMQNKLSAPFLPEPCTVVKKEGSSVTVETPAGVQFRRNSAHLKKLPRTSDSTVEVTDTDDEGSTTWTTPDQPSPTRGGTDPIWKENTRPKRAVRRPLRYEDYELNSDSGQ